MCLEVEYFYDLICIDKLVFKALLYAIKVAMIGSEIFYEVVCFHDKKKVLCLLVPFLSYSNALTPNFKMLLYQIFKCPYTKF